VNTKWDTRLLGDILEPTETLDPQRAPNSEFEYIDVSSVSNKTFRIEQTQTLKGRDAPSRARRRVKANDVLFATVRPTLSRIALVPNELDNQICSTGYFVLRPRPGICARFLFYFLLTEEFNARMEQLQKGASYPAVTDRDVRSQPISFPESAEQRRIVGLLDKAFAAIATAKANTEKNLQNARALFTSRLESVFAANGRAWPSKPLADLTSKIGSGATPLGGEKVYQQHGVPFIRSLNVHDEGFRHERLAFLRESQAADLDNVTVKPGDVLLNITGASIARSCLVPENLTPARVSQHVSIVRPIPEKLDSEFLHYLLISRPYKTQLLQAGEGAGATRQALTKAGIERFRIEVPPRVEEQRSVASQLREFADATRRLESMGKRKLDALDGLKCSLLNAAFVGAL